MQARLPSAALSASWWEGRDEAQCGEGQADAGPQPMDSASFVGLSAPDSAGL